MLKSPSESPRQQRIQHPTMSMNVTDATSNHSAAGYITPSPPLSHGRRFRDWDQSPRQRHTRHTRRTLLSQLQKEADRVYGPCVMEVKLQMLLLDDVGSSDSSSSSDDNDNVLSEDNDDSDEGRESPPPILQPPLLTPVSSSSSSGAVATSSSSSSSLMTTAASSSTIAVPENISHIHSIAESTVSDTEAHILFVARPPVMVLVHKGERVIPNIIASLADGSQQINAMWMAYSEDTPVPELEGGDLIRCNLLILRRLDDDHQHTIDMRVIVVDYELVEPNVVASPSPSALIALPWWEAVSSAASVPAALEVPTSTLPHPSLAETFECDGSDCSIAMNLAHGHAHPNGDDYGLYTGDGEEAHVQLAEAYQPLVLSHCVLNMFTFPSLHAMREMNRMADLEIHEMDQSKKRHLHYYYIAIMVFHARRRLELPACIKNYVHSLFPDNYNNNDNESNSSNDDDSDL